MLNRPVFSKSPTTQLFAFLALALAFQGTPAAAQLSNPQSSNPQPLPPGKVVIELEDLHCASCAKKVARKLYAVKGVRKVMTNVKADRVTLFVSTKIELDTIALWQAVEAGEIAPLELRHNAERISAEQMTEMVQLAQRETVTQ